MSAPKQTRKAPAAPAEPGADDKNAATLRTVDGAKPPKLPRKRRPRFVL